MTDIAPTPDARELLGVAARAASTVAALVPGVHALGTVVERASHRARERVGLAAATPGVRVEEKGPAVLTTTVSVVVAYPAKILEVADEVRHDVVSALSSITPRRIDVDVIVSDVHGPLDEPDIQTVVSDAVDDATVQPDDAAPRA